MKFLNLPIEEWFRYHPPETKERQAKHDDVNALALEVSKLLSDFSVEDPEVQDLVTKLFNSIEHDELRHWAVDNINLDYLDNEFDAIMKIQQLRMIANQSITVLELQT